MPLRKATPEPTSPITNQFTARKRQATGDVVLRSVLRKSYEQPDGAIPPGLLLRKISSASVIPISSAGEEQNGEYTDELEKLEIRVGEVVAKQPIIVRKTPPPQSRRPSFEPENIAGVRAHPIPGINRYYSLPKGRIQARPLLQPNAITSLNPFDSGYSRYPVQWNRSLGRRGYHGYQQRRPLVSNSMRGSRG